MSQYIVVFESVPLTNRSSEQPIFASTEQTNQRVLDHQQHWTSIWKEICRRLCGTFDDAFCSFLEIH